MFSYIGLATDASANILYVESSLQTITHEQFGFTTNDG